MGSWESSKNQISQVIYGYGLYLHKIVNACLNVLGSWFYDILSFLNASKYCGSVLKNDFVVLVVVVLVAAELLSNFKESCHFENPVKTCRKWKFVGGGAMIENIWRCFVDIFAPSQSATFLELLRGTVV